MLLAVDIGNTNITLGVFEGQVLQAMGRLTPDVRRTADEYAILLDQWLRLQGLAPSDLQQAVIGSVVPPLEEVFAEACRRCAGLSPFIVQAGIKTGIRIRVDNPKEVGADRVANAIAGYRIYGGPLIVVDFGTATTFDVISQQGDYLGGAIAPGLAIAAEALSQRAAKLYQVELVRPKQAIGRNTVAAMQSGLLFGYVGLVEGIIHRLRQELGGSARVVATGGLGEVIAQETEQIELVDRDLTLVGLRLLYEANQTA